MSSNPPGTGHPDGEARGMPHGSMLQEEVGKAVTLAGTQLITGGFWEVGGYRSLVVAVKNTGANDVQITPSWDFIAGSAQIRPTETQTVAAGTAKRLLFQNQGDILPSLIAKGVGGASTITYYLAPANLDPLPTSAPDTIALWGVNLPIPAVVGGFNGQTPWSVASVQKTGRDVWSFTLNVAGDIEQVLASAPGIYEVHCSFHFDAPSAVTAETCVANIFGTIPITVQQSGVAAILTTGVFEGMVGALTHFQSGAAIFTIQANFDRATTGLFRGVEWWIKRWAI